MKATKIVRLEASNVKRLRAVEIEPDGSVVVISGRNAQGKSSVLDAIWMALGGKRAFPRTPVREGEGEAKIRVEFEDLIVDRRIKPNGSTQLVVSSREGARYPSPQAMLDALVGQLSFDPLAFSRMKPDAQRELLRKLVGLDTSAIDSERAALYDERTAVGREIKRLEGELSGVPHHEDAPADEVSVSELAAELQAAEEHQRRIDRAEDDVSRRAAAVSTAEEHAENIRARIASLEEELRNLRGRLEEGEKNEIPKRRAALEEARERVDELRSSAPDREAIAARLRDAEGTNAKVRTNRRRSELEAKLASSRKERDNLSSAIEGCDRKRAEMIAGAQYPLEGLAVDEHGVLFRGLPLEQASSAEQLRVSVAIGLALNPRLRVLLVRDGSLLDDDSMRMLGELAAEADAQVWLERVGPEGEVGVVIEDGAIVGAEQAAE